LLAFSIGLKMSFFTSTLSSPSNFNISFLIAYLSSINLAPKISSSTAEGDDVEVRGRDTWRYAHLPLETDSKIGIREIAQLFLLQRGAVRLRDLEWIGPVGLCLELVQTDLDGGVPLLI
jgi:hypothetical protein